MQLVAFVSFQSERHYEVTNWLKTMIIVIPGEYFRITHYWLWIVLFRICLKLDIG